MSFCKQEGCYINAAFGFVKSVPIFCKQHKEPGMVNVKSQKCLEPGCTTQPRFGVVRGVASYCIQHKGPEMFNVVDRICQSEGCAIRASYGLVKGGRRIAVRTEPRKCPATPPTCAHTPVARPSLLSGRPGASAMLSAV